MRAGQPGRIVIPQKLRKYAGLEKDAVIIGVNDRAEIWSAETWNAREEEEMTQGEDEGLSGRTGVLTK